MKFLNLNNLISDPIVFGLKKIIDSKVVKQDLIDRIGVTLSLLEASGNPYLWLDQQLVATFDVGLFELDLSQESNQNILSAALDNLDYSLGNVLGVTAISLEGVSIQKILTAEYTPDEMNSLLYSLRQYLLGQDYRDIVLDFIEWLKTNGDFEVNTNSVKILVFLFDFLWLELPRLTAEMIKFTITKFFSESILLAVPIENTIREILGNAVYPDYQIQQELLLSAFSEIKSTDLPPETKSYQEKIVAKIKDNFYLNKDVSESDLFEAELERLDGYFLDESKWPELVTYFSNKDTKVKFNVFLQNLKDSLNIEADNTINFLSKFSAYLQEHRLLSAETDLIIFDQSTSQFTWNTDLLT